MQTYNKVSSSQINGQAGTIPMTQSQHSHTLDGPTRGSMHQMEKMAHV